MSPVIQALIVDDDAFIHFQLQEKIKSLGLPVRVVATCKDAAEGVAAIRTWKPNLVFLDVQMPGSTGFELLQQVTDRDFQVIFITSHNEYAIQAIRYSALDYLLKPIQDEELKAAIERFRAVAPAESLDARLQNLSHNLSAPAEKQSLVIPTRTGDKSIPVNDILYCQADSNYTHFFMANQSRFTASKTLKEIADSLNQPLFVRIHKSFLVNKSHVKAMDHTGFVRMKDDTLLEVSRRRMGEVRGELGR